MGEARKWLAEGQNGAFEALRIFEGTPREAATGFPANLNVAVALSLAGIGADRMTLEILGRPLARTGTCTGSRSSRIPQASRCRSKTCRRTIQKPAASPRCLSFRICANWARRVGSWWIDSQAAPIRPRQRRPQKTPCFVPEPRRTAPWCIRAGARQKPPTSCPVRR